MENKRRVYFSHSIRGKLGADCPIETQEENCAAAIEVTNEIRLACPEFDIYVPAENEEFVQIAFNMMYLTEKQILDVDCVIVDNCDIVLVYVPEGDELQGGRLVEYTHAKGINKPVLVYATAEAAIVWLKGLL